MSAVCELCGAPMVRRTARRGPNAGGEFFGCSGWRPAEQHSTWALDDPRAIGTLQADHQATTVSVPQSREPRGRIGAATRLKVSWSDASTSRDGWLVRYVCGGASLRCWPERLKEAVRAQHGTAWMAVQDLPSYEPAAEDTRRVLGMMQKILQRGLCPPVPPAVEAASLSRCGVAVRPTPQSLTVEPTAPLDAHELLSAVYWTEAAPADEAVSLDSDEERIFLQRLLPDVFGERVLGWALAQAPLDRLLRGLGRPEPHARRIDFLLTPPGGAPFAVEIDGQQHDQAVLVDEDRDAALRSVGVPVVRIPASDVASGTDALRLALAPFVDRFVGGGNFHPLVHGPIQAHRLMLALVEALRRGFLAGARWCLSVVDDSNIAAESLPEYLAILASVDALWGGDLAPRDVRLCCNGRWHRWMRDGFVYAPVEPLDGELDVEVRLEISTAPLHELGSPGAVPTIVVRSARIPVDLLETTAEPTLRVPPRLNTDEAASALRQLLRQIFAKPDFREGQLEAVLEVLHGRDSIVLLPTGAGKSLIYQLAGLCLPGRTLVIDPLIALMEDQLRGLAEHGIDRVVGISRATTAAGNTEAALEQVAAGDALFVFVAPERLQQAGFRDALRQLSVATPVNLAVVDEAHCVSEWGHAFRTSYLDLGKVIHHVCRDAVGQPPPILALTGTASRAVLRDVLSELRIELRSANTLIRPRSFDRPELSFTTFRTRPDEAGASLLGLVRSLPARFALPPADFFQARGERTFSGLVFVPHVNGDYGAVNVAERLSAAVGAAVPYYAGSAPKAMNLRDWDEIKRQRAEDFKSNRTPLLVSTNAFGMGIDKPNIRYVIHYGIPGSIEAYYQEVGRAGRDGHPAQCLLLLSEFDETAARRLLDEEVDLEYARNDHESGNNRHDADDVHRQLWFHFNAFAGLEPETATLLELLDSLGPLGRPRTLEVPMGDGDARQRAIHRLVLLGVIDDYLVDWGAKKFTLTLASVTAERIADVFLAYVERSQPGRAATFADIVNSAGWQKPEDAVRGCAPLLIGFVYDTIERARRRSLREMWLAARESAGDAELRARILDFLTEGDVAPRLERLLDQQTFAFEPWLTELHQVSNVADAREWRGTTARLLASYPDHPGLLLGRAVSEVTDPDGNLREFASAIEAAARSALRRYNTTSSEVATAMQWTYEHIRGLGRPDAAGVLLATLSRLDIVGETPWSGLITQARSDFPRSVTVAAVYLPDGLLAAIRQLDELLAQEVESR